MYKSIIYYNISAVVPSRSRLVTPFLAPKMLRPPTGTFVNFSKLLCDIFPQYIRSFCECCFCRFSRTEVKILSTNQRTAVCSSAFSAPFRAGLVPQTEGELKAGPAQNVSVRLFLGTLPNFCRWKRRNKRTD